MRVHNIFYTYVIVSYITSPCRQLNWQTLKITSDNLDLDNWKNMCTQPKAKAYSLMLAIVRNIVWRKQELPVELKCAYSSVRNMHCVLIPLLVK